jgi:hypothetical protein
MVNLQKKIKILKNINNLTCFLNVQLKKNHPIFSFYCSFAMLPYLKILKEAGAFLNFNVETITNKNYTFYKVTIYLFNNIKFLEHGNSFSIIKELKAYKSTIYCNYKQIQQLLKKNINTIYIFSTIDNQIEFGFNLIKNKKGGFLNLILKF